MQNPTRDIQEMIKELNRFQLPSSLMESFDIWREDATGAASREIFIFEAPSKIRQPVFVRCFSYSCGGKGK